MNIFRLLTLRQQSWNSRRMLARRVGATLLLLLMLLGAVLLPSWRMIQEAAAAATGNLVITMKDVGDENGFTLKTVKTERQYHFTRPQGWQIQPSSVVHVSFQHSPALLPERSALNVLVNGRILKTIRLGHDNITPTQMDIPLPPETLKDHNMLTFQVDQHYTYDCEDPFSAELWTTILPDTTLRLDYTPLDVKPDLAKLPYPLIDELDTYKPIRVGYSVPTGLSRESLEALSTVLVSLGQSAAWREFTPVLVPTGDLGTESLVLVGTPSENPAIASLAASMDVQLSGSQFSGKDGSPLPADAGVIQLVPNPSNPSKAILVVSGNGPEGVRKAAKALAQNPSNRLLAGKFAIIKDFQPGPEHPIRAWDGFIQHSGDTFQNLGLETQTARGITSLPILYKIKKMPDLFLPGQRKVKVHTVYSYASQLSNKVSQNACPSDPRDTSNQRLSTLEVRLNGKALKSIPLDNPKGETYATMDFEINSEEFFTFNDLEYQFHLFPEKFDKCRFVTDVHIWGTVHNTSWIELPGEVKTAVPDVGLMNDAGFPFTAYQDLSQVGVVMPKDATDGDKNVLIQTLTRLGRESASRRGINIRAVYGDSIPGDVKGSSHLIVIGHKSRNPLMSELNSKSRLVVDGQWAQLRTPDGKQVELSQDADQGLVEEMISPFNDKRVVMLLGGENDTAMNRIAALFMSDKWFGSIQEGNLVVVNDDGPKSLTVLTRGEAKFLYPQDLQEGFVMPTWGWILIGFLSVLGLFSILRFIFGR